MLPPAACRGLTLLEVLIALLVAALVFGTATPAYFYLVENQRAKLAVEEITGFARRIDRYQRKHNRYPDSLAEALETSPVDPWGNTYKYQNLKNAGPGSPGPRTGANLAPLNSDYDLYSEGRDAASLAPVGAEQSRDDVIRARNGDYIGLASDFRQ